MLGYTRACIIECTSARHVLSSAVAGSVSVFCMVLCAGAGSELVLCIVLSVGASSESGL